jgi:hypothetical protein
VGWYLCFLVVAEPRGADGAAYGVIRLPALPQHLTKAKTGRTIQRYKKSQGFHLFTVVAVCKTQPNSSLCLGIKNQTLPAMLDAEAPFNIHDYI